MKVASPAASSGSSPVRDSSVGPARVLSLITYLLAVGVEPATRLRALRWHISRALEAPYSARVQRDSTFFVRRGNSFDACRAHVAIEEITQTRVCDLVLVLAGDAGGQFAISPLEVSPAF